MLEVKLKDLKMMILNMDSQIKSSFSESLISSRFEVFNTKVTSFVSNKQQLFNIKTFQIFVEPVKEKQENLKMN